MFKAEAQQQWKRYMELNVELKQLTQDINILRKELKEIKDLWTECKDHKYDDGFCHKCGLPQF